MFHTMTALKAAHSNAGGHWFDPSAMSFFNSRVSSEVYGGQYFVSSEKGPSGVRYYSVRAIDLDDFSQITTIGDFQQYATRAQAHAAARKLGAAVKVG